MGNQPGKKKGSNTWEHKIIYDPKKGIAQFKQVGKHRHRVPFALSKSLKKQIKQDYVIDRIENDIRSIRIPHDLYEANKTQENCICASLMCVTFAVIGTIAFVVMALTQDLWDMFGFVIAAACLMVAVVCGIILGISIFRHQKTSKDFRTYLRKEINSTIESFNESWGHYMIVKFKDNRSHEGGKLIFKFNPNA